ncbi:hypothetical protein [Mycolicibacterium hippocampi]|uniref:hypothetical protein n=1 Tax=Mycolicibacterium hippocampi TaxID=659824 RepID=UPI003517A33D
MYRNDKHLIEVHDQTVWLCTEHKAFVGAQTFGPDEAVKIGVALIDAGADAGVQRCDDSESLATAYPEQPPRANRTYAEAWAGSINETYEDQDPVCHLYDEDLRDGESYQDAERRILAKAARCLRNGIPATFTGGDV